MINKQEVMDFAREFGLSPDVIEKDYVLGWMLAGISADPAIGTSWVFKGGTCLKKCYFETYRFSEDLDFTLTDPAHLDEAFLLATFTTIAQWIYDRSGIEIPADTIRFEPFKNPRGNPSVQGRVGYRGPTGRLGNLPRIKLDLTNDEVLVLNPTMRAVHHPYSDRSLDEMHVMCYAFEEVFAEKIRALAERGRPRDLYDVIHLYRHDELQPDRLLVVDTLRAKCEFKGISVPTLSSINKDRFVELEADWVAMLAHQLPALPPFEQFWSELPAVFDWLLDNAVRTILPGISGSISEDSTLDLTWRPPAMTFAWHTSTPLELIRFAAANRLCVDLSYGGEQRLIEPYSLRRTKDSNLLLYAVKHQTGEIRSYRVDRIHGARATDTVFVPRFVIELTPVGEMSAPSVHRQQPSSTLSRLHLPRGRKSRVAHGPLHVYECPYCHKTFNRSLHNSSLKKHNDKSGYPCPGRTGVYVDTKY